MKYLIIGFTDTTIEKIKSLFFSDYSISFFNEETPHYTIYEIVTPEDGAKSPTGSFISHEKNHAEKGGPIKVVRGKLINIKINGGILCFNKEYIEKDKETDNKTLKSTYEYRLVRIEGNLFYGTCKVEKNYIKACAVVIPMQKQKTTAD